MKTKLLTMLALIICAVTAPASHAATITENAAGVVNGIKSLFGKKSTTTTTGTTAGAQTNTATPGTLNGARGVVTIATGTDVTLKTGAGADYILRVNRPKRWERTAQLYWFAGVFWEDYVTAYVASYISTWNEQLSHKVDMTTSAGISEYQNKSLVPIKVPYKPLDEKNPGDQDEARTDGRRYATDDARVNFQQSNP